MVSCWLNGNTEKPLCQAPVVLYPMTAVAHEVVPKATAAHDCEQVQTKSPMIDIEPILLRIHTSTDNVHIDRHVTNNHHTEHTLLMSTSMW